MYALLKVMESGREVKAVSVVSVIISALSVGVSSATLSFDFDVDPMKRRECPSFYGYVPDSGLGRTAIFVVMTLQSSVMLLVRSFSTALLINVGSGNFGYIFAAEMGFYLLYKLVMRDAYYWMPIEGIAGVVLSFVMRFVVKIVTDYTGVIQFR
jgi:hypothetical protein